MLKDNNKTWYCTNDKGDDITLVLHDNGHVRLIMDFIKDMKEEDVWTFIETMGYKIKNGSTKKKTHLTVVK
jgi:hypothetical protein